MSTFASENCETNVDIRFVIYLFFVLWMLTSASKKCETDVDIHFVKFLVYFCIADVDIRFRKL